MENNITTQVPVFDKVMSICVFLSNVQNASFSDIYKGLALFKVVLIYCLLQWSVMVCCTTLLMINIFWNCIYMSWEVELWPVLY